MSGWTRSSWLVGACRPRPCRFLVYSAISPRWNVTDAIGSHRVIRCQSYKASATLTSMAPSPRRQRSTGSRNTPGTLGTPTYCVNASMAASVSDQPRSPRLLCPDEGWTCRLCHTVGRLGMGSFDLHRGCANVRPGSLFRFGTFILAFGLVGFGFVAGFLTPLESRSA